LDLKFFFDLKFGRASEEFQISQRFTQIHRDSALEACLKGEEEL
jgi:hypothetical protein